MVWKPDGNGGYVHNQTLSGHKSDISDIIQLNDGRIVSSSKDRTLIIWKETIEKDKDNIKYVKDEVLTEYTKLRQAGKGPYEAYKAVEERYEDMKINPSKRLKNIYLQNMLKQNRTQLGNEPFDATHAGKNIPSVRGGIVFTSIYIRRNICVIEC